MLKWLMRRGLAAFERRWNYDASYVHEMGHGKACTRIVVDGAPLAFDHGAPISFEKTVAAAHR